jgi:hypothetical protein
MKKLSILLIVALSCNVGHCSGQDNNVDLLKSTVGLKNRVALLETVSQQFIKSEKVNTKNRFNFKLSFFSIAEINSKHPN